LIASGTLIEVAARSIVAVDRWLDRKWPESSPRCVEDAASSPRGIREYRTIWISDFHLGTARCKAADLLDFLRNHRAATLFLVGDIIDGWSMGPGWAWTPEQTAVVEEIWAWRQRGARIVFIPGNHDENDSELVRMMFGPIECRPYHVHRTAEGRRMLVIHGHQFDGALHGSRWLYALGSLGYSAALRINLWYNRDIDCRSSSGSLLRRGIKSAVHQFADFSDLRVCEGARTHRADGVICGHTHRPVHRSIGPILYVNDGDWVQSRSALVENGDGSLRLVHWRRRTPQALEGTN
jgi:UDP-2,3-diacylglucosamine pyrophosphatase LpxH